MNDEGSRVGPDGPGRSVGRIRGVALFTAAYLAVAGAVFLGRRNLEFLFYIAVILALAPGLYFLHRRVGLSGLTLWGLSIWGLFHMAGGLVPVPESWPIHGESRVLYSLWLLPGKVKYDHAIHAYGFAVATVICWESLQGAVAGRGGRLRLSPGLALLCAIAGMGLGAVNEVLEFFAVLALPETNVGGYRNTAWDLVSNTAGALAAAGFLLVRRRAEGDLAAPSNTEG